MSYIMNHASINLRRLEENRHKKLIEYQHVKYKRILRKRIQMVLVPQKRTQMVLEVTIQLHLLASPPRFGTDFLSTLRTTLEVMTFAVNIICICMKIRTLAIFLFHRLLKIHENTAASVFTRKSIRKRRYFRLNIR